MAYEERLADGNVVACGRIGTGHKVRRASRRLFQPPREDFHDNDCTVRLGSTTVACRARVFPLDSANQCELSATCHVVCRVMSSACRSARTFTKLTARTETRRGSCRSGRAEA